MSKRGKEVSLSCITDEPSQAKVIPSLKLKRLESISSNRFIQKGESQLFGLLHRFSRLVSKEVDRFEDSNLAKNLALYAKGGPMVGRNFIRLSIDKTHLNAGSKTEYIWLYFGTTERIKLCGLENGFPAGRILTWDFNQIESYIEDEVKADWWDEIALEIDSSDPILIDRIEIQHSSQTILDWTAQTWLDASPKGFDPSDRERHAKMVLTAKILDTKLKSVNYSWIPQIHWAAQEISKTNGTKYGRILGGWCSEFTAWCLRKALWDPPKGNISAKTMEKYFQSLDRFYTCEQVLNRDYGLMPGDYLRIELSNGGEHSGFFVEYIDDPTRLTTETKVRTIEGNSSLTVKVNTRSLAEIVSVGNCQ